MKRLTILFSCFLFFVSYGQSFLQIKYIDLDNTNSQLDLYDDYSIFTEFFSKIPESTFVKPGQDNCIIKNHERDTIFFDSESFGKVFYVKNKKNLFDWQIGTNTKEILGYNCLEATADYRGHVFTAYFTTDIFISDGPNIFNGLPGLILKVTRDDLKYRYQAVEIKNLKTKENDDFYENFLKNDFIPFDEFLKTLNDKTVERYKYINTKISGEYWGLLTYDTIDNLYIDANEEIKRLADKHNGISWKELTKDSIKPQTEEK
ncbi:MAG: GLPGLI family protein [Flavobacteriaceae bacterium]|jgi:GLPGLI family protein|nr:GLPGLI family protein [Flavobacteriaceae bacterium]